MKKNNLAGFGKNIYSQYGEDGIIEEVFKIVKPAPGEKWCVEFGAWDGVYLSNACNLIRNRSWNGVLIEPNSKRFDQLKNNYKDNDRTILINKFVNTGGVDTIDRILSKTPIPKNYGLLSVDIDGNDYYIWKSVKNYTPSVVIIEYNPTIPAHIEYVQPCDPKINRGTSLLSLCKLARKKGYELIYVTDSNAIFVLRKYFSRFGKIDNSPEKLMPKKYLTDFFQLYDGTVVLRGCKRLLWHGIDFDDNNVQILPRFLRRFSNQLIYILRICKKLGLVKG